ncbi:hypothetical protein KBAD11_20400 [Aeromonas dhakensis]|nr:hypothetical protein KBAD11_20400 [Aeromonas dhakensis]CAD7510362.1 hypothetical protein KBAD03_10310 [Aeromonas dhakensis]CAD7520601.1 hypothetical protein KBAD10_20420 [Aeromonas dhakensis]CAD7532618.1 hypothetical protein KBAD04_25230 [Aeromonas dhakensis]
MLFMVMVMPLRLIVVIAQTHQYRLGHYALSMVIPHNKMTLAMGSYDFQDLNQNSPFLMVYGIVWKKIWPFSLSLANERLMLKL